MSMVQDSLPPPVHPFCLFQDLAQLLPCSLLSSTFTHCFLTFSSELSKELSALTITTFLFTLQATAVRLTHLPTHTTIGILQDYIFIPKVSLCRSVLPRLCTEAPWGLINSPDKNIFRHIHVLPS